MNKIKQLLSSLDIVILITFTISLLMAALLFFVTQSNSTTQTLIDAMEQNQIVTRKMQLYGQLAEYARSRTRLSTDIILEEDVFAQDSINIELEVFANKYTRGRLELLSLPLDKQEKDIIEQQNSLVQVILPAQRQAVTLAMKSDRESRRQAQKLMDEIIYPGQGKLIDGFLRLMDLETQRQRINVEKGRVKSEAWAEKMDWIAKFTLLLGFAISLLVIFRVHNNQKEVRNSRLHLETIVEEKTHNLLQSEERLIRSQEIAHVGTWDWDIKENIIFWSDEIFRVFGLIPHQFQPTYEIFKKYIHKDDVEDVDAAVTKALDSTDNEYHVKHRIIRVSGEERYVEELGQVVRDDNGTPIRMIGVVHDITDRVQAEKVKNEFVSIISHELRTPLTAIQGSVKLILGSAFGDLNIDLRNVLELADNNCDRLLHLVNDILDLQKMESGKMEYHFADTSLSEFMDEVFNSGKPYADAHHVALVNGKVDEATIHVDKMRLIQVMNNLISNAVKFSDKGAEVKIFATLMENNKVRFAVKDNGRGIPKEHHDKLFKQFTQVDSSDKREKLGTGLGLAISRNIVKEHQGKIWFESEVDVGTTFYFEL